MNQAKVFIAGTSLDFQEHGLADQTPTGAQIAALAGFTPRDVVIVVQFLRDGEFEDLRPTETSHVSRGDHFLVARSDRTFRLTIDGRRIDWPAEKISGKALRTLGKVPVDKSIYLEKQDTEDAEVQDEDVISLRGEGVEVFYSKAKAPKWELNVQGVMLVWHEPTITVRTAMEKTGFDTTQGWHIFLRVKGQPKQEVQLDTVVDLRTPGLEKIRLTPKDVHNGESAQGLMEFALLDVDEAYLNLHYPGWETFNEGGRRWLLIHDFPLPAGYAEDVVDVALEIPPTYPGAQIDMFYVEPHLSLPGGGAPAATDARVDIRSRSFQRWSRHRGQQHPWNPSTDNIVTQLALVEAALLHEVSP